MLYSEMVTADAIIHGDRDQLLRGHHIDGSDDAVTLQLGGSDPSRLAEAVHLASPYRMLNIISMSAALRIVCSRGVSAPA